jgi:ferric-dicitrate binding protein FerR (iron transport regulator)
MDNSWLKYFDPEVSAEEKEEILLRLKEDPAAKEEFLTYLKTWSLASFISFEEGTGDVEHEYQKQEHALRKLEIQPSDEPQISLKALIQFAAIFILLVGLGILGSVYLKPGKQIAYNTIVTNTGEKAQITLADGTRIWLNASSTLRYPANPEPHQVHVYLRGEAFFDVKHQENRLFQVHAANINIKVLGTAFNVKSYPEERIVETTLVRGKVRIEGESNHPDNYVILLPNQKASYLGNSSKLIVTQSDSKNLQNRSDDIPQIKAIASRKNATVVLSNNINTQIETSWKDGQLQFVDEQFSSLAVKMERWFGVKITIEEPKLMTVRYTGTFEKETIEQALRALSISLPFKYAILKDSVTIWK